jgi:hypothetical protein
MDTSVVNYIPFEEMIQSPQLWEDLVRSLAISFKKPRFTQYTESQYSEDREWQAVAALNGRVPMASLINRYDGKPIIGSEKPLDMHGDMPTFGNKVVFTSKEFNRIAEIERAIQANVSDPTELLKYLKSYMERLYVGPLISIDKIFFEAFSNGTSTILADDNLTDLDMSIDWKINKYDVGTVWSNASAATGITDLSNLYWALRNTYGIVIDRYTMNRKTLNLLLNQASTKQLTTYYQSTGKNVKWTGTPSMDSVNFVLENNFGLPPIQIEDYMIDVYNDDGITVKKSINAFQDGRVTGSVGGMIGTYIWSPADEQRRPDKDGTVYQVINNVLTSTRQKRGNVSYESELNAIAVPTLLDQMGILVTDATTGDTALPTA